MRRRLLTDLARLVRHAGELGMDEAHVRAVRGTEDWQDLPVPERVRRGQALWKHGMERVGPDLPVRLARLHTLEDLGALGLAMRTSETLGVAWERLHRYHELFLPMPMWRLERGLAVRLVLLWRPPLEPPVLRVSREFAAALFAHLNQSLAGVLPAAVTFDHEPEAVSAFAEAFGVSVTRADEAALVYPAEAWDRPLLFHPDPGVAAFILEELDALSARGRSADDFLPERLRDAIRRRLPSGAPAMTEVARALGMTERTLRRRLEALGTTYTELVDRTREELARELVRGAHHSLAEVAYLLGFSEPSAFHRAFKRWTGRTPARFRGE